MDGRCSAAIARRKFGERVDVYPMDYGEKIPWKLIYEHDEVFIVDFSFSREDMIKVAGQTQLTWIDHHKTSIEDLSDLNDLPGKRSLDQAGCVLSWKNFYPNESIPQAVLYIGDRDIWRNEYAASKPFGEGLYHEDSRPTNDALWEPLLSDAEGAVDRLVDRGEIIYQARMVRLRRLAEGKGFAIRFEGYSTLAINYRGTGDLGELIRGMGYEIAYCYIETKLDRELRIFVTLYSEAVDVSEIARKFGGGGHPGAAGFSFVRPSAPFPEAATVTTIE